MLLQLTTLNTPFNLSIHDPYHVDFSSNSLFSLKFQSGFSSSSIIGPVKTHRHPVFTCYTSRENRIEKTIDFEKKSTVKWKAIYKRLSSREEPKKGVNDVLNQWESEGNWVSKADLSRIVKEFRKFKLYNLALEVYEWLNNRESINITSSDGAIQLDLIAKVRGTLSAEKYFMTLPDSMKDRRIYGALLNVYGRAGMKEKAESLLDVIKSRGFAPNSLPYNVIMTLYMKTKEFHKVESVISEMREKDIPLDIYSYNIWLTSCGSQQSEEKLEEVLEQMKQDETIRPNWTTFSTLATLYFNFGYRQRAEVFLRKLEGMITGNDRMAYHYLISIYGTIGKKSEVYRVWNIYKSLFLKVPNFGYYTLISSLVRLGDIEGAENVYNEWDSVKSRYDPRIGNLLLDSYVRKGFTERASVFYDKTFKVGGKTNSRTWEILAESHLKERRTSEAVYCLRNAVSGDGLTKWRPKPGSFSSVLKLCEEEGDMESKEILLGLLKQIKYFEDENYTADDSAIDSGGGDAIDSVQGGGDDDGGEMRFY